MQGLSPAPTGPRRRMGLVPDIGECGRLQGCPPRLLYMTVVQWTERGSSEKLWQFSFNTVFTRHRVRTKPVTKSAPYGLPPELPSSHQLPVWHERTPGAHTSARCVGPDTNEYRYMCIWETRRADPCFALLAYRNVVVHMIQHVFQRKPPPPQEPYGTPCRFRRAACVPLASACLRRLYNAGCLDLQQMSPRPPQSAGSPALQPARPAVAT